MSGKDRLRKEQFINYELYSLLSCIDRDISNVIALVDSKKNDVNYVWVKYHNGNSVKVNVECDSLAAITKDVIEKLFF